MQDTKDPFELLLNAGSSPEIWLLVGGPLLLLTMIVIVYTLVVIIRRRKERDALQAAMEAEGALPSAEHFGLEENRDQRPKNGAEAARPHLRVVPKPDAEAPAETPAAGTPATDVAEVRETPRAAWLPRLRDGLKKTRESFRANLEGLLTGKTRLDEDVLERLQETLYRADIGAETADKLVDHLRKTIGKAEASDWQSVSAALREEAKSLLAQPSSMPLNKPERGPWVILIVGVNGVGKTTTIGKLGAHFLADDKQVIFGAGDTFRAAAIEQLGVWGHRLGVDVVKHKQGSDPAAVAYDAVKAALARKADALLIDTAGRLHAKAELMDELGKINRIIGRDLPGAPHETWLVIDATTGQNAVQQVKAFGEVVKLTGLVVTKLDGTAKGGVVLGIVDQFKLPVRFIGVGEKAADLRAFEPTDFADSLF